jgi:hypothetical protein
MSKKSTFARFSEQLDFRLLQQYLPMADIASAREHAGQAQASWPSFKLEQDLETRARL